MTDPTFTKSTSSPSADFSSNCRIICRVCEKQFTQYTCPRCNIRYCSLQCYKSHNLHCTESFMRDNVIQELQQVQPDEESKQKMLDILKRFHEEAETDGTDEEFSSFLSEETMQKILSGGSLSYDELSINEKKHFNQAIASGELGKLIEPWSPWWLKSSAKQILLSSDGTQLVKPILTQESVPSSEDAADSVQWHDVPPAPETPLPPISKLTISRPSPLLTVHFIDVIYSYCFTLRLYNGDWITDPLESVMIMLSVSSVLDQSAQPESVFEALLHCLESTCSSAYKHIGGLPFGLNLMDDVSSLLNLGQGALVCLLNDLHKMIQTAVNPLKLERIGKLKKAELKRKFQFAERKVYFMMCWVHEQPAETWSMLEAVVNAEKKSSVLAYADGKRSAVSMVGKPEIMRKPLIKEV